MAQESIRPSSDVAIGSWADDGGGTTDIFQAIDEVTPSDTDYVESDNNPSASTCEFGIADPATVTSPTLIKRVEYRLSSNGGGRTLNGVVRLKEGGGDVQTWSHSGITATPTTFKREVTNAVTNWANVTLEFEGTTVGGGSATTLRVYWARILLDDSPCKIRSVRVSTSTSTGTQDITLDDFADSGQMKAALFIYTWADTDGTVEDSASIGAGATDGTNQWACGTSSENGNVSTDVKRQSATDECVMLVDPAGTPGTVEAEAAFSSWLTDGVQINWGAANKSFLLTVVLIAGDDVSAKVDTDALSTTTQTYSSMGFEADVLVTAGVGDAFADSSSLFYLFFLGLVHNNGGTITQRSLAFIESNGNSSGQPNARMFEDAFGASVNSTDATVDHEYSASNFTTSGFDHQASANPGTDVFGFLGLKFANQSSWVGTVNSPTSTGNDTQTGPSFQPQFVLEGLSAIQAVDVGEADADAGPFGIAAIDADAQYCNAVAIEDASATMDTQSVSDDKAINLDADDGTDTWDATFVEFTSTGWTLNFSATDGTARKWIAFAVEDPDAEVAPLTVSVSDSIGFSDDVERIAHGNRDPSDSLGLSDDVSRISDANREITDSLGLSDTVSRISDANRITTDNLGLSDAIARVVDVFRQVADSMGLTDTVTILEIAPAATISVSDNLGMSDAVQRIANALRLASDNLGLSDTVQRQSGANREVTESLGFTDAVSRIADANREISDDFGFTDEVQRAGEAFRQAVDNIGLSDELQRQADALRQLADNLGLTDDVAIQELAAALEIRASDNLGFSDAVQRVADSLRNVIESLGFTDTVQRTSDANRLVDDSLGWTTAFQRTSDASRTTTDSLGATTQFQRIANALRQVSDTVGLSELISTQVELPLESFPGNATVATLGPASATTATLGPANATTATLGPGSVTAGQKTS